MIDYIVNEMIIASRLTGSNNVSYLAGEIGYRPLLIITAMYRGQEQGKLTYNQKKDTISIDPEVSDILAPSEPMKELMELVEQFITYRNAEQRDETIEQLQLWLGGTPMLHLKMVAHMSPKLATYEIADPKDKKSVYTFVTLARNIDKKFGESQFKKGK